jgi:H+/Cl- antiporter ClcA
MLAVNGGPSFVLAMADADAGAAPQEITAEQADATMASRPYVVLLIIVSVIGVVVAFAAWCYLEGLYQIQRELFTHLPHALGYSNGPPKWWYVVILGIGGLLVALAIELLPGDGGHIPARGLSAGGPSSPRVLPGVILAGLAATGFGLVLGPEGPLIALGAGVAVLLVSLTGRDLPPQTLMVVGAAGSFTALAFIFDSPMIAAVILIEATGLGGPKLRVVLLPGLLAAGIGTLVSLGLGSFTGLSNAAYALGPLDLHSIGQLKIGEFGWTIALSLVIAVVVFFVMRSGMATYHFVSRRRLVLLLPVVAVIIAGVAIAFAQASGKSISYVLFDGQAQLPGLVAQAGGWSIGTLLLLILAKGVAYSLSLGSFRGGPTFPAIFLGAAGGILASHLPGFPAGAGVAVGVGVGVVCVLRLPLASVVLATLLCTKAGTAIEPLVIVGVVVAYVMTLVLSRLVPAPATPADAPLATAGSRGGPAFRD